MEYYCRKFYQKCMWNFYGKCVRNADKNFCTDASSDAVEVTLGGIAKLMSRMDEIEKQIAALQQNKEQGK